MPFLCIHLFPILFVVIDNTMEGCHNGDIVVIVNTMEGCHDDDDIDAEDEVTSTLSYLNLNNSSSISNALSNQQIAHLDCKWVEVMLKEDIPVCTNNIIAQAIYLDTTNTFKKGNAQCTSW
jgi:hypothetical protein